MLRTTKTAVVALAMTASALAFTAGPADAATGYANCTALHRVYKYGVAKSAAAADKQARTGHYRPAVKSGVYAANAFSDRDKDGTACEVSR